MISLTEAQKDQVQELVFNQYRKTGMTDQELFLEMKYAVDDIINSLEKKDFQVIKINNQDTEAVFALFATLRIGDQQRIKVDGKVKYKHEADYIHVAIIGNEIKFLKELTTYIMSYTDGSSSEHTHQYELATDNDMNNIVDYLYF